MLAALPGLCPAASAPVLFSTCFVGFWFSSQPRLTREAHTLHFPFSLSFSHAVARKYIPGVLIASFTQDARNTNIAHTSMALAHTS